MKVCIMEISRERMDCYQDVVAFNISGDGNYQLDDIHGNGFTDELLPGIVIYISE